ncbi:MAG: hypothetical protein ACJ8FV_18775 [Xanthobacteraceae bacterium]|jgi:hypothetical protein
MATTRQYRVKAAEYAALAKTAQSLSEAREFRSLERNFNSLAASQEWLASSDDRPVPRPCEIDHALADEEQVLRCLGAAVIMQWNALPTKIRQELFAYASSVTELPATAELKGQIARFLHNHKDDAQNASRIFATRS